MAAREIAEGILSHGPYGSEVDGIPHILLERVASGARIRALARMLDDRAELEDDTVEVREAWCGVARFNRVWRSSRFRACH